MVTGKSASTQIYTTPLDYKIAKTVSIMSETSWIPFIVKHYSNKYR